MNKVGKQITAESKRTKIVATISDRNCSPEFINELYDNGMNVVRFNTAHQMPEDTIKAVENVRKANKRIPIMVDTKGPEVRTTKAVDGFTVEAGDKLKFKSNNPDGISQDGVVYLNYPGFVDELSVGDPLLIDDGSLIFEVVDKKDDYLLCEAKNNGAIESRKSVNTPGVSLKMPSLSEKDRLYIDFCIENDIDYIAHSFVRHKKDLTDIQEILDAKGAKCKIIAKIENQEGVDNIDEIIDNCAGIMVARGDLAVEIPRERIPAIQKQLIKKCRDKRKPVIVATQMLHTMIKEPTPTRAEVSDVANAIYDGTDATMLSGETAYGKYPVRALKQMASIIIETEKHVDCYNDTPTHTSSSETASFLCKSAVEAASQLGAEAIIADTISGNTVRNIAGYRPCKPIFALCYDERTTRELALSYGVKAYTLDEQREFTNEFLVDVIESLKEKYDYKSDDRLVFISGNYGKDVGASFLKVARIKDIEEFKK